MWWNETQFRRRGLRCLSGGNYRRNPVVTVVSSSEIWGKNRAPERTQIYYNLSKTVVCRYGVAAVQSVKEDLKWFAICKIKLPKASIGVFEKDAVLSPCTKRTPIWRCGGRSVFKKDQILLPTEHNEFAEQNWNGSNLESQWLFLNEN